MKDEPDIIFEIKTHNYFIRIIFIAWICFAIVKFEVNPNFFSISIAIATILLVMIPETSITAKHDVLEIIDKRWLPFLNKTKKFHYIEIQDIKFEVRSTNYILLLISFIFRLYPYGINIDRTLIIKLKDSMQYIRAFGSNKQNEKLVESVKLKIGNLTTPSPAH